MVSTSAANESECPDEKEAADTAKRAAAAANKALFKYRLVRPGSFKTENHFYPRVINSQIHPTVRFFMGLSQERIVERYCHMHPKVDRNVLMEVVRFRSEHFHWAGCDLMHTVNNAGERKMVSWFGGGWVVRCGAVRCGAVRLHARLCSACHVTVIRWMMSMDVAI